MNIYQKLRKELVTNCKKHLGKFWHICMECGNTQFTKKLIRNCKKCGNKNTVYFVSNDGMVYPEEQKSESIEP